jgi:hypothetical protein
MRRQMAALIFNSLHTGMCCTCVRRTTQIASHFMRTPMRTTFLSTLAAAAILFGGFLGNQAEAFTATAPSALGGALSSLVRPAANLCGTVGCMPVQTKKIRHFKNGTAVGQHI